MGCGASVPGLSPGQEDPATSDGSAHSRVSRVRAFTFGRMYIIYGTRLRRKTSPHACGAKPRLQLRPPPLIGRADPRAHAQILSSFLRTNDDQVDTQTVGVITPVILTRPRAEKIPKVYQKVLDEHAKFIVNFAAILELSSGGDVNKKELKKMPLPHMQRPHMTTFAVKSHWMDNVRVRKMCDEMLHLESGGQHKLPDPPKGQYVQQSSTFMRTLQLALGQHVHALKMSNNPEVTIGGYFIISQMLSYIKVLVSLDLSSNNLTAAEARVLSLGLKCNHSVQELRMKDNMIGSEGATTLGDMLKVNDTMLLLDLRMNNIRGAGFCALADAVSDNTSLTDLDMRWNYAGECSDFVEIALTDLKNFCFRNMIVALQRDAQILAHQDKEQAEIEVTERSDIEVNNDPRKLSPPPSPYLSAANEISHPIGRLEVTIISARNLPQVIWTSGKDGEYMALPQAYCTFTLNKQTTSTSIQRKNHQPTFNHTVSIDVRQVWQVCTIKVMHSKALNRTHLEDYVIGNVSIPVGAVINWRGVQHVDSDGTWRAYHRPAQVLFNGGIRQPFPPLAPCTRLHAPRDHNQSFGCSGAESFKMSNPYFGFAAFFAPDFPAPVFCFTGPGPFLTGPDHFGTARHAGVDPVFRP